MFPGNSFDMKSYTDAIFRIASDQEFNALAMELFHYQEWDNHVYREYCRQLQASRDPGSISWIPFLPIEFFRDQEVVTGKTSPGTRVFTSSGTTGSKPSKHFIPDMELYEKSFLKAFTQFYGDPSTYSFLALLPGYLERPGSSLVFMMDHLIRMTERNGSGFYLHNLKDLSEKITRLRREGRKIILFGVSFALLDLAREYPVDLEGVIIMETGGMKGRGQEMVREELHHILCEAFNVDRIHSEYGMTELMTQAYSTGKGIYRAPPWMRVMIRDINDPLSLVEAGDVGGVNIIDLANVHSCGFLATQDLGRLYEDGSFEVLGRYDNSDVRGCNLMIT